IRVPASNALASWQRPDARHLRLQLRSIARWRSTATDAESRVLSLPRVNVTVLSEAMPDRRRRSRVLKSGGGGRHSMKRQAVFLSVFAATILALPAFAADGAEGMMGFRWG